MSRRHPSRHKERESRAERALYDLCVRLGYCIPPDQQDAILAHPPVDADAFGDAVLIAEGRDPNYVLKHERRPMLEIVTHWVFDDRIVEGSSTAELSRFPSDV